MPELPEVQTTVNFLNSKVLKRTFVDVWADWQKTIKKPKNFSDFKKELKNKKIIKIWRRSKNIIFDLSEDYCLLVHQKMTGHLLVGKWNFENKKWTALKKDFLSEKINSYIHVMFFLDNDKMIAFSDARKFGKIELWKKEELLNSKELSSLGPEPLDKNFTFEKFQERIKNKKRNIKQLLMDQHIIAGIGNIYASESLWRAKINPQRTADSLKTEELEKLYFAIKKVLETSITLGGESFSDYRKPDGSKGGFDSERKVYKREGQKCQRCGRLIKRIVIGQRSTFFCSDCQK